MKSIGKYIVEEVIGRGGMGTVYRARDPVIGRNVAVKVIAEHVASLPNIKERLYKEAKSAGGLSHENIMTVFDIGEHEGHPYLVMELLDGHDLRTMFDSGPSLGFDAKMDIALQICRGLEYAHSARVIHRDIKPENIRVLSSGRVKIVDFGIARLSSETRTLTHASIGTPRYMSPEQVRGAEIDERADIFSFGVLLYELLTGINPFDGSHVTAVIYKILHEEPEPIQIEDEHLCEDLQRIVSKCLEKNADLRYPNFASVIKDLNEALLKRHLRTQSAEEGDEPRVLDAYRTQAPQMGYESTRIAVQQTGKPPPRKVPEKPPQPRRGALVASVAAGVVLLGLAGYMLFFRDSDPDPLPEPLTDLPAGIATDAEIAEFREAALEERSRMLEAKDRIPGDDVPAQVRSLFDQALASERSADEALDEETSDGYRRAADRFAVARTLFEAVAESESGAPLAEQAERSRRSMEQARQRVHGERSDPAIAEAFSAADRLAGQGNASMEGGNHAAAMQLFGEAERVFRDARRTLDNRAAEALARRQVEEARRAADASRERVLPWREAAENVPRFRTAEELRAEGIRLAEAGRLRDAADRFEQAASAYAAVTEPAAPAVTRSDAERARTAMQNARASVPEPLRTHERHAAAAAAADRGEEAYRDERYDTAQSLFEQAAAAFTEVAALPAPRSAEEVVLESVTFFTDRFRTSLENQDVNGLRSLHPFFGGYSAMFDIAENIRADVRHSNLRLAGERATVLVTVDLTYRNRTQRMRQEDQQVSLLWTLERGRDDEWTIREVTRQ